MAIATPSKPDHKLTLTALKQTNEMRLIFKLTLFAKTSLILNPFSNKLKLRRLLLALENNDVTPNKNYGAQTNITLSLAQP